MAKTQRDNPQQTLRALAGDVGPDGTTARLSRDINKLRSHPQLLKAIITNTAPASVQKAGIPKVTVVNDGTINIQALNSNGTSVEYSDSPSNKDALGTLTKITRDKHGNVISEEILDSAF